MMLIYFKPSGFTNSEAVAVDSVKVKYKGEFIEIVECDESIDVLSYDEAHLNEKEAIHSILKEV